MTLEDLRAKYPGAETFTFGDGPDLCAELLLLVRSGKKTATCGALLFPEQGLPFSPCAVDEAHKCFFPCQGCSDRSPNPDWEGRCLAKNSIVVAGLDPAIHAVPVPPEVPVKRRDHGMDPRVRPEDDDRADGRACFPVADMNACRRCPDQKRFMRENRLTWGQTPCPRDTHNPSKSFTSNPDFHDVPSDTFVMRERFKLVEDLRREEL